MEEIIKQELQLFSNHDFTLPFRHQLHLPRYDRHTSFTQFSNWTNSDKFTPSSLPRITSRIQNIKPTLRPQHNHLSNSFCPIKQMDINLEPLKNDEESYYCKYLKGKNKLPLRQIDFITSIEQKKRRSQPPRNQVLSTGRLKEIYKRKKDNQYNVKIDEYLRTTQLRRISVQKSKQK